MAWALNSKAPRPPYENLDVGRASREWFGGPCAQSVLNPYFQFHWCEKLQVWLMLAMISTMNWMFASLQNSSFEVLFSLSLIFAQLCLTLYNSMDYAHRASLSMKFSRQEYWSGLPFPSPGDSFQPRDWTQGSNPGFLHCRQTFYCLSHQGSPFEILTLSVSRKWGLWEVSRWWGWSPCE